MAADNKTLARFILDGIPPSPRGVPQVEVSFDIDANGILHVKAVDKASGKSQSVKIEASTNLSKEEIEKFKQDAAKFAAEDTKKKELIEVRNQAESISYLTEKSLKDAGDKLSEEVKTSITEKLESLKKLKDSEDVEAIKSASDALSSAMSTIGEAMSKDQPQTPPSGDQTPPEEPSQQ